MAKHTLKILRCEHCKIFKVCLAIFQHYAWKVKSNLLCEVIFPTNPSFLVFKNTFSIRWPPNWNKRTYISLRHLEELIYKLLCDVIFLPLLGQSDILHFTLNNFNIDYRLHRKVKLLKSYWKKPLRTRSFRIFQFEVALWRHFSLLLG